MNDIIEFAAIHNFRVKWQPGDWPLFGGRCSAFLQSDGVINALDVLNGTNKGAEEILWCMAAAYLHRGKGNTIVSAERSRLDQETTCAARLAMDIYRFMKKKGEASEKKPGRKQLTGQGVLLSFPNRSIPERADERECLNKYENTFSYAPEAFKLLCSMRMRNGRNNGFFMPYLWRPGRHGAKYANS
jgi:hypothetical protein